MCYTTWADRRVENTPGRVIVSCHIFAVLLFSHACFSHTRRHKPAHAQKIAPTESHLPHPSQPAPPSDPSCPTSASLGSRHHAPTGSASLPAPSDSEPPDRILLDLPAPMHASNTSPATCSVAPRGRGERGVGRGPWEGASGALPLWAELGRR